MNQTNDAKSRDDSHGHSQEPADRSDKSGRSRFFRGRMNVIVPESDRSSATPTLTGARDNLMQRVQETLAEALQVPIDWITQDLQFGDLPQWDSMGHMEVMMQLEAQFEVEINADTIASLTSVPSIYAHLSHNGAPGEGNP